MEINLTTKFLELRKAFNVDAKYVTIAAGRRSGKTYEAFIWLIHELLMKGAKNALWVDTVHGNIDKYVDRYAREILGEAWPHCNWNFQKKVLRLPNETYIDFGSAQKPENLEGFEYDRIVINEGGIVLKKPQLWDNSIQPMSKGDHNKTRVIGTPKGKNRFHELFQLGQSDDPKYASFRFSAYESPYWDDNELNAFKPKIPAEVWRQEYMAEFLDGAGSVFRNIEDCIVDRRTDKAENGKQYVMGVDLAKHQDFTVITVAEKDTNHVVFMDRFNQIDWGFQKKRIIRTWQAFNKPRIVLDSTGVGDAIYDDLRAAGVNVESFKFTSTSKKELVQNLSVAIENKDITFLNDLVLVSELEVYTYEVTRMGNISYNAPEGLHDDAVMSLGLVNHGLRSGTDFFFVANY